MSNSFHFNLIQARINLNKTTNYTSNSTFKMYSFLIFKKHVSGAPTMLIAYRPNLIQLRKKEKKKKEAQVNGNFHLWTFIFFLFLYMWLSVWMKMEIVSRHVHCARHIITSWPCFKIKSCFMLQFLRISGACFTHIQKSHNSFGAT